MSRKRSPNEFDKINETLNNWAERGEPDKVLQGLLSNGSLWDKKAALDAAQRALNRAAESGAEALVELALKEMLRFDVGLLLRVQYLADRRVKEWDDSIAQNRPGVPGDLQENLLPAIQKLQNHVADISKTFA